MNAIDLINGMILITLLFISLAAMAVVCSVVFPNVILRARRNAEQMPIRAFLIGLINYAFFGLIAVALLSRSAADGGRFLGALIGTLLLGFVLVGLTAIARFLGERLRPNDANPIRQLVVGMVTLELAALVPFVGWFLLPLIAGLIGYGALIIALIWRK